MLNFSTLENFSEVAILFSKKYRDHVKTIYNDVSRQFPHMNVFLVPTKDILCAAKCDAYESYILVGVECPHHRFKNAVQFKIDLEPEIEQIIREHDGPIAVDSIYNYRHESVNSNVALWDSQPGSMDGRQVLVVTENQQVLDYYSYRYENVRKTGDLESREQVRHLMKENSDGERLLNKRMVGVIFTGCEFEPLATSLVNAINQFSRAYKIFLKDISFERLISIDHIDCLVLVDCPFFQCRIELHVPILSPFAVNCFISEKWSDQYSRNRFEGGERREITMESPTMEITIASPAGEILESRWYKGAVFEGEDEDMDIHEGQRGIAMGYEGEGKR